MIAKLAAVALVTGSLAPLTNQDQAYFAILAETKVGRMAGMPPMDLSQIPPGFKLPAEALMFSGQAARQLNVRLWSPGIAPDGATAVLAPPAGLKKGNKLNLMLYRPKAGQTTSEGSREFDPDNTPDYTIKIYWGSSETVQPGQPKIIKWTDMGEEARLAMKERAREVNARSSYFYKPNWTTGYWPNKSEEGVIDKDASLVGKYSLTTSYTGNVDIEAPTEVDFLPGIIMSSPNLDNKIDLKKFVAFEWSPITHALGLNAAAIGMEGKNTLIMWSSSEVFEDNIMGDMGFLQMAQVRDFVSRTIFMPGDRTKMTIPAGIFENVDFAMLNMAGYGPGAALETAQPLPRIQTKTTLMLMLGGKKVRF